MPKYIKKINSGGDMSNLIQEFLDEKRLKGLGEFTISASEFTVKKFFEFYQGELKNTKELSKAVQAFLMGKSNAYYNKQLSILGQFFKLMIKNKLIQKNPCEGLKFRSTTSRIIDYDEDTIKKLLKLPNQTTFSGFRDYVFMVMLLDTGIRPYEAIQLKVNDIQENTIRVRAEISKTRIERYLPISKQCLLLIKRLIAVRDESWDKQGVVFCSYCGEHLHRKSMQLRFKHYSKFLGVNITVYHLRHTFALWYIRNGGSAFSLQRIMGHSTMDMTRNYVNIAMTDVRKDHSESSPIHMFLRIRNKRMVNLEK